MGFKGIIVSDWLDVERLNTFHKVVPTKDEAYLMGFEAGIDVHMHGPGFAESVLKALNEGRIDIKTIDERVGKILEMKFRFMRLGMICEAITDLHTMLMNRVLVDEDCLVIGITVSANESVVNAVNIAKQQGAKTVLITSKKSEELQQDCDELVLIAMKNALEQGTAITPQFPVLVIVDILYSYYKEIDKERKRSIFSNTLHAIQPE